MTAVALAAAIGGGGAQAQLRVVDYNVAGLNGDLAAMGNVFAALAADDIPGFAVAPHVYVFQEVRSTDVSLLQAMLNAAAPGVTYMAATYTNTGEDGSGGAEALFYRSDVLLEYPLDHADLPTGAGRYTDRWHLWLPGYDSPDATLWVYGSHLKASVGFEDERHAGVIVIRDDADAALPAGAHVIYTGDMNFYDNMEAGYLEFLSPGPGQAIDPLGSGSWAGITHAIRHTQSPLLDPPPGSPLVGGGMDDRFDLQLSTTELHDDAGLSMIPGSYRSLGNDGNHYNQAINAGTNSYYPGQPSRSNALADDLEVASDHVPVVVDYRLPARIAASLPANGWRVIQGATHQLEMTIANGAPAVTPEGADDLVYGAVASGALSGTASGSVAALSLPNVHGFTLDTATVGGRTGTVTVTGISQGSGTATPTTTGVVLRHAAPSFSATAVVTETTVPWTVEAGTGVQVIDVAVHNQGFAPVQALLDVDAVSGAAAPFSFEGGLATGIGFAPATLQLGFDTDGAAPGPHMATLTIETSDEDVPGESVTLLTLNLDVTVEGGAGPPGDLDDDGDVDFADLLLLLGAWGPCPPPCPADLDGSGDVGFGDLLVLLASWG